MACALLAVAIMASANLRSQETSGSAFERGVKLYQDGSFREAEQAFREASEPSSTVYYNLGNACYKQGKLGEAVLNWEKSLALDPLDSECAHNLEIASRHLRDAVPPDNTALPLRWLMSALFGVPLVYLEYAAAILWLLANTAFLAHNLLRGRNGMIRTVAITSLAACSLAAALLGLNLYRQHADKYGILLVAEETLRSGPGEQNTGLMQIHEGLKVKVLNTQGDWAAVKIAGGYSGWLPRGVIGLI